MSTKPVVYVGLSGGVDSSVAATRLLKAGYTVVGVFIKVWHPDFLVCNWKQERLDAMRVAAKLNLPFLTCDAEASYRDDVAHYFIEEYKAGRTPNPDVMCNQHVKFGAFLRFAKEKGADFIATGHYAQRMDGSDGPEMHRGIDSQKDQTYFLWSLSKEQLSYSLFPIGDTPKEEIRKEAEKYGLPVAKKKDSQGVCFLGHVDIPEFLSHYISLSPGPVLDEKGEVIGEHKGALVYTLGQRHGFSLHTHDIEREPMFVVAKDIEKNTVTVSPNKPQTLPKEEITLHSLTLRSTLTTDETIEAQFRYRQKPFKIKIVAVGEKSLTLIPVETGEKPAVGQSCVLYRGSHCIGGGIVS